ncbi:MAG: endo-1,4-beta-xylanase [Victivallales bacterium]
MNELASELTKHLLREDAEVEFRIRQGTEMYRKGFGQLHLETPDGKPVGNARIRLRQKTHEFLFGCNAFMLGQFPEEEQNRQYEETFASLFNEAVIPFYWSDLEPEDGKLRFESGSVPIYRRPPTDDVLDFCRRNGITPKGHPLCWHNFAPEWLPETTPELMRRLDRRFAEIAERYGDKIFLWDCVNEAQSRAPQFRKLTPAYPDNHVHEAFRLADRHFPTSTLLYNDDRRWWNLHGDYSPVYLLVRSLLDHGCRVGGLGLQYHMFDSLLHGEHNSFMNPRILFACLDLYGKLGIPVNFSEVSIISRRDLGDGDAFQELVTEKLYRLWFSHPAVDAITWWNLVDGTAAYAPLGSEQGENSLRAGLVNYDFSPKPAFKTLERLIRQEWHTETELDYRDGAMNLFHGFYGDYEAEISTDSGTFRRTVKLSSRSRNITVLKLE